MDLAALADFNRVVASGGFGAASRLTGRPKATLSRRVRDLEESLGVRLFERGGGAPKLTDEGRMLYERTEALLAEILEAGDALASGLSRPRGRLRVSAPILFAHLAMSRIAIEFRTLYPDLDIDVIAEDRTVDLVEEKFDVASRINPRPDTNLVGRRFARDHLLVAAAPSVPRPKDGAVTAVTLTNGAQDKPWIVQHRARRRHTRRGPAFGSRPCSWCATLCSPALAQAFYPFDDCGRRCGREAPRLGPRRRR